MTQKGFKDRTKLSKQQAEILQMYTIEHETPTRIAIRRGTSKQAVYKTINKLKAKGIINRGLTKTTPTRALRQAKRLRKGIRLHGVEFNARILYSSGFYQDLVKRVNLIYVSECPVRLYRESVEVFSGRSLSFWGEDQDRAWSLAMDFFDRVFRRLEHRLRVILVKEEATQVRVTNSHYASVDSGVARDVSANEGKVKIYARDDGKLWFLIDKSWNVSEDETVHPVTSKEDRRRVSKQLNDWRHNDPPTLSEIGRLVYMNARNMAYFGENLRSHIQAVRDLSVAVRRLNASVRRNRR